MDNINKVIKLGIAVLLWLFIIYIAVGIVVLICIGLFNIV